MAKALNVLHPLCCFRWPLFLLYCLSRAEDDVAGALTGVAKLWLLLVGILDWPCARLGRLWQVLLLISLLSLSALARFGGLGVCGAFGHGGARPTVQSSRPPYERRGKCVSCDATACWRPCKMAFEELPGESEFHLNLFSARKNNDWLVWSSCRDIIAFLRATMKAFLSAVWQTDVRRDVVCAPCRRRRTKIDPVARPSEPDDEPGARLCGRKPCLWLATACLLKTLEKEALSLHSWTHQCGSKD